MTKIRLAGLIALLIIALTGCGGGGGGTQSSGGSVPLNNLTGGNPSSNGNGGVPNGGTPLTAVGNATCLSCHASLPDNQVQLSDAADTNATSPTCYANFGQGIGTVYANGVHSTGANAGTNVVQCELCHGDGSQHFGQGPIPVYNPGVVQCSQCHSGDVDPTAFNNSAHGNPQSKPDEFFFQNGFGTAQASFIEPDASGTSLLPLGPAFKNDGKTAVTINEHIEECSACHSYSTKLPHVSVGDVPNPPQVSCASCHDAHQPADAIANALSTRPNGVPPSQLLNFKPQQVNNNLLDALNNLGGPQFGAKNLNPSVALSTEWIRPTLHFQFHVGGDPTKTASGYLNQSQAVPANTDSLLRLSPERLCASCHTKGTYQFTAFTGLNALNQTHNDDVFTQYLLSAHADRAGAPMSHFSMVGGATNYPVDMGSMVLPAESGTGKNGSFACMQCHNGVGSIDYTNATFGGLADSAATNPGTVAVLPTASVTLVKGANPNIGVTLPPVPQGDTDQAHILWGDCSITCITCHDPHQNSQGHDGLATSSNVRVPKLLSFNTSFHPLNSPNGQVNNASLNLPNGLASVASTWPTATVPLSNVGNQRGGEAAFQDLQPLPPTSNSTVCLLCHQGRESGLTLWNRIRLQRLGNNDAAATNFAYLSGDTVIDNVNGFNFDNPHYLPGGALLFSANSYEFLSPPGTVPTLPIPANNQVNTYSKGIPQHQSTNCVGCHMDSFNANAGGGPSGGHTFNPQIATCLKCHSTLGDLTAGTPGFHDVTADGDWAGLGGANNTVFNEIGILVPIPPGTPGPLFGTNATTTIQVTDQGNGKTVTLTVPVGGSGLMGLLNQALFDKGILYNPNGGGTYFVDTATGTKKITKFTPNTIGTAFDLADIFKTGGANGQQAAYVHNPHYTAQILVDAILTLRGTTLANFQNPYTHNAFNRPSGPEAQRPAINYITQWQKLQ